MAACSACLSLLMLSSVQTSYAQGKDVLPVKPYLGIKIGGNFSYISGDSWSNGVKSNLVGGAYVGIKGLHVGIQAEALFAQSTYTTGDNFHNVYGSYFKNFGDSLKQGTFRVNQLCIPLLLQVKIFPGLWLQGGAQYTGIVSVNDKDELLKDAKAMFKTNNIAGVAGATFFFRKLNVGARYIFDFSNANATNISETWNQRSLQLHVGLNLL